MNLLGAWNALGRFKRRDARWRGVVFFAETGQDWHHLEPLVSRLIAEPLARPVCYLTSDPKDPAFECQSERLRCFHVPAGFALILAFKTLRADVLVLTMMDLGTLELQRSAHPVHYVYVFHSLGSTHMVDHATSYDHYDTILCAGPHQMKEIARREERFDLRPKRLLPHGYARIERLIDAAKGASARTPSPEAPTVLIAPTWGPTSILEVCGEPLIEALLEAGLRVILRPHYETARHSPRLVGQLRRRFQGHPGFDFEGSMADTETLLRSDVLVSDWSAMAVEYALGLARPVLFIDVPPRVRNPDYRELGLQPIEVSLRDRVGTILPLQAIHEAPRRIAELLAEGPILAGKVESLRGELVFNLGQSAQVGADAIAHIADEEVRKREARERDA